MKNIIYSTAIVFLLLGFSNNLLAQSKAYIYSIETNGANYEVTIKSEKEFYVGGNTHYLHIGNVDFSLNKQINENGTGTIIFYISNEEFSNLTNGETVWMTYGNKLKQVYANSINPETFFSKNNKNVWLLGKLNKG